MSHIVSCFVEILGHPRLNDDDRQFIGMKGRKVCHYPASNSTRVYLTDKREVVLPDGALRQIVKKKS